MAKEEPKKADGATAPFPLEVNGARGEVPLWIGDVPLVIAATMAGLSATSTRLECKSLADLFTRLSAVEISATMAGIAHLTVRGENAKALEILKLSDMPACADAFAAALSHHFGDSKKGEAAKEAAE